MKRIYLSCVIIMLIVVIACTKKLEVASPSINITLEGNKIADTFVYKVGDTVSFQLIGTIGNLAFYPGILGYNYDYRFRTQLDSVHPKLSFTSTLQWGTQTNTLKIFAVNHLNALDSSTVVNSNWVDVTNRAILSTSATAVNSGYIDLSDVAAKPSDTLYIAYVYSGTTGSTQRTWTITNYRVDNVYTTGSSVNITTVASEVNYWTRFGADAVNGNTTNGNLNWVNNTTQLQIVGGGVNAPTRTCWLVTRPLIVGGTASDISIPVKNINDPAINQYDYIYTSPGLYKAVWVGFNNTAKEEKFVIKTFYIRVTN